MVNHSINIRTLISESNPLLRITELEKAVEKQPWCAAYRILLAKAYKEASLPQFESKLQLASLYSGDREHLFHLVHRNVLTNESSIELVELEKKEEQIEQQDHQDQVNQNSKGFVIEGSIEPAPETKINFEEIVRYDPTKDLVVEPNHQELKELIEYTPVYNPEVELEKLAKERQEEEHDFMYWINHVGEESATLDKDNNTQNSVSEVTNLLEQFLKSNKRTQREKREFFKAETKANQSEIDDSELVSETLAKLYEKQELFEKAISAYQKLSLQNPNKSAYFAARITELEYKIHHKEE